MNLFELLELDWRRVVLLDHDDLSHAISNARNARWLGYRRVIVGQSRDRLLYWVLVDRWSLSSS